MDNISIDKMSLADLKLISDILESDFDDFWNYNILKRELQNTNSIYLVCKLNAEIVGFAGISIVLDTAELNNIVIKKKHRGNGFSSILLSEIINICESNKCTKLNLEVNISNVIAINLYKKFGFEQVGKRKNYYKNIDGLLFTKNI